MNFSERNQHKINGKSFFSARSQFIQLCMWWIGLVSDDVSWLLCTHPTNESLSPVVLDLFMIPTNRVGNIHKCLLNVPILFSRHKNSEMGNSIRFYVKCLKCEQTTTTITTHTHRSFYLFSNIQDSRRLEIRLDELNAEHIERIQRSAKLMIYYHRFRWTISLVIVHAHAAEFSTLNLHSNNNETTTSIWMQNKGLRGKYLKLKRKKHLQCRNLY